MQQLLYNILTTGCQSHIIAKILNTVFRLSFYKFVAFNEVLKQPLRISRLKPYDKFLRQLSFMEMIEERLNILREYNIGVVDSNTYFL